MVAPWLSLFAVILRWFVDLRTSIVTSVADAVAAVGSSWFLRVLRIGRLIALIPVRRMRQFFAVIPAIIVVRATVDIPRLRRLR